MATVRRSCIPPFFSAPPQTREFLCSFLSFCAGLPLLMYFHPGRHIKPKTTRQGRCLFPAPRRPLRPRRRCLLRRRRGRRRLPHSRLSTRAPQDPVPDPKRRPYRIPVARGPRAQEDVGGGRLARVHARQRHKLHPHCAVFGCAVRQLQLLQDGR